MAKKLLFSLLILNLSFAPIWAAPPEPAVSGAAALNDDAYERARQKLREQLQSLGQSVEASTAPVSVPGFVEPPKPATNAVVGLARVAASDSGETFADLPNVMRELDGRQKLATGDRVSYRVLEDREDAKPLALTDSGEIEVPYLGRFKALDKTCKQLAAELKTALERDYYRRATVIINLDALNRSRGKVYVFGHVRAPGSVEIPGDEVLTVSKLILRVGGFAEFADKRRVRVTRKTDPGDKQGVQTVVNVEEILEKGKAEKDMIIKPDDMIFVPVRLFNF